MATRLCLPGLEDYDRNCFQEEVRRHLTGNIEKIMEGIRKDERTSGWIYCSGVVRKSLDSRRFQYSTHFERCCIVFGILLAVLSGFVPPIVNVLYGEFCNLMIDRQFPTDAPSTKTVLLKWFGGGRILQNASSAERREALLEDSRAWGIGCGLLTFSQFLLSFLSVFLLSFLASRQISRIRILFFKSVLCKDLAWFDTQKSGNFAAEASENLLLMQKGISDVLSVYTFQLVVGIVNVLISFLAGWLLSVVLVMFVIPVFLSTFFKAKAQSTLAAKEMTCFARAGSIAEEVLTHIKTVVAFEGENKEVERYSKNIKEANIYGIKRGVASSISNGLSWFIIYCCYAVAFMFGVRLIEASREDGNNDYTPAILLTIFFGIVTALTNIGFASIHIETFSVACGAAASIFNVIKTKSEINPCSEEGEEEVCKGEIEFRNVHFEYPSRPRVKVLKGINLKINDGEVVAIVGRSGVGKSTILQLVQRLYDPSQGEILLDGKNLKSFKVSSLRQQLGVVGQEPSLFSTTIRDNIWYGNFSATDKDIVEAAIKANAHDFIIKLKEGYNSVVGQKGSTLSGGQKQRIAIARALIRNPKILILDEATSALDVASDQIVQAALDKASVGRTTLIVTHRLSTISHVNRIIVLDDGVVAEDGTHAELVAANGIYKDLLESQIENIKGGYKQKAETLPNEVIHKDIVVLPPGSRNRFSSISGAERIPKVHFVETSEPYEKVSYLKIIKWSKPEWSFFIVGSVASIIAGSALPTVCVLFGYLVGLLSLSDFDYIIEQTNLYTLILLIVGILAGIGVFLQMYCFSVAGVKLSTRLRIKAFNCMIHQEMAYFDDERNKVGALCLRLSRDVSGMQGAVGIRLGILLQALSTMIIGIMLSYFFNWKITMVALATVPFVFVGVYVESMFFETLNSLENKSVESASKIAVEVISLIRVVASLSKESFFIEKYSTALKEGRKSSIKKSWLRGFAFAIGQTAPFFGYAVTLWYGGTLVANENLHYKYVITVSELLIFGAWTLGQSVVLGPSIAETKAAAGRLNYIFTRKPRVFDGKSSIPVGIKEENFITFSRVHFAYPKRPEIDVLKDFNMKIKAGESVGVMGTSGSGKSTIIQLLLRFYDPTFGFIRIKNVCTTDYKLSVLRKKFGLVSQEPVLFDRTIQENIAYGDNSRQVSESEVIEAAKAANIHSFIASLPLGYETTLGSAGTQLSGGQKQRIAIARVLVRNPEILLLDEATSALDTQSESFVQEALDEAASERTTITVAHRLAAVRNVDIIYIIEKGSIIEFGTHEELINLKGIYYSMYTANAFYSGINSPGPSEN